MNAYLQGERKSNDDNFQTCQPLGSIFLSKMDQNYSLCCFDDVFTEAIDGSSQQVRSVGISDTAKYNMATRYGADLKKYIFGIFSCKSMSQWPSFFQLLPGVVRCMHCWSFKGLGLMNSELNYR